MEDKEQKIRIEFETNADETAKKVDSLTNSTTETSKAQDAAGSSSKNLSKNLQNLDTPINSTISGMSGMLKQMWLIVANPLGAILAAVALVLIGLVAVFKSFQPVVDKVEQAMAALGAVFNVVKNAFLAVFTGTKSLGEAFGGLGSDMDEAASSTMKLVKAQQDLDDVLEQQEVSSKKARAEINKLNVELKNRTLSEEQRIKIADKIDEKENALFIEKQNRVNQEIQLAKEAIRIKGKVTNDEIAILNKSGKDIKDILEKRGGNYDEEIKILNAARSKAIDLEDEKTVNLEKNQNKRDKLEDDQQAKADKLNTDTKARNDKAAAEQKARNDKAIAEQKRLEDAKKALIKQGQDFEDSLLKANQDLNDKTDEEKLARQKERALAEIEALKLKGIDVENITRLNDEKFATLEQELAEKRRLEKEEAQKKTDEEIAANKKIADDKALEDQKKVDEQILAQKKAVEDAKVSLTDKAIGFLGLLAGKNKKLQKAALIAEAAVAVGRTITSAQAGNAAAIAQGTALSIPTGGASEINAARLVAMNNISSGISIASIIASTGKALSALGGGSAGGSDSGSGGSNAKGGSSATPQVSFQASSENQIGNALANKSAETQPIKAYIVESDVTTAQSLANNRITSNSI